MPGAGETRFNELPPGERFTLGQRNEFKAWRIHDLSYLSSFAPTKATTLANIREAFVKGGVAAAE
jgi:hypothetical protein